MPKPSATSFLKIGPASKVLGVSIDTLRRWEKSGKITTERTSGGTRLYSLDELKRINPYSVQAYQNISPETTENLLRKVQNNSGELRKPDYQNSSISDGSDFSETTHNTKYFIQNTNISLIEKYYTSVPGSFRLIFYFHIILYVLRKERRNILFLLLATAGILHDSLR